MVNSRVSQIRSRKTQLQRYKKSRNWQNLRAFCPDFYLKMGWKRGLCSPPTNIVGVIMEAFFTVVIALFGVGTPQWRL